MNADSSCPRLSPAEWLLERPKSHQKAARNPWFPVSPSFIRDRVKDRDKPAPPHQTGREVFPHPAFRHSSP